MFRDEESLDRVLNSLSPPKGSRPRRIPFRALLLFAAVAMGTAALGVAGHRLKGIENRSRVIVRSAHGAAQGTQLLRRGHPIGPGRVTVESGGQLELVLEGAFVAVNGPAELSLREGGISLFSGVAAVEGRLVVEGAGCEASVEGSARLERFATHLRVRTEDGVVVAHEPVGACLIAEADASPER